MINAHKGPLPALSLAGINFKMFPETAQEMYSYICLYICMYVCVH